MVESEEVKVTIERTGGVTGIPLRRVVSNSSLNEEERQTLQDLLDKSHFFDLTSSATPPAPDRYVFVVAVQTPIQTHTVKVNEADIDNTLRALIDFVAKMFT